MRFMLIVKATRDSEVGWPPDRERLEATWKYNEQLARAGVLIAAEELHPNANGVHIAYCDSGGHAQLTEIPLFDSRERIAGFALIDVRSREEAVEWAKRMPDPHGFGEGEIELRQVRDSLDFY